MYIFLATNQIWDQTSALGMNVAFNGDQRRVSSNNQTVRSEVGKVIVLIRSEELNISSNLLIDEKKIVA